MGKKQKKKHKKIDIFAIYPGEPAQISQSIQAMISSLHTASRNINVETWEECDIAGKLIIEGILDKIDNSDYVIADITRLNFNVIFEIGYAIGKGKRVILIVNKSLSPQYKEYSDLGIFDTLGYQKYSNSDQLLEMVTGREKFFPIRVSNVTIDKSAPAYILDTLHKTDASLRVISRIKKSRVKFRSFDPHEIPRLSLIDAYKNVCMSTGVVINLLSKNSSDFLYNNYRGALLAGLSYGMEKEVLLLQEGDDPVPLDYRDLVSIL